MKEDKFDIFIPSELSMLLRSFLHGICLSTDDSTISNWKPSPHYLSFFLMRFVFFFLIIFQFTNACEKLDCNLMFSILNFDGRLNEMQFSFSISFYLNRIREIRFLWTMKPHSFSKG